jgi:hypothetical protein
MKRGFFTENKLIDINEEAISVFLNEEIDPQDNLLLKLEVRYEVWQKRQKREKKKNAYCIGRIYHKMEMTDKPYRYRYVIKYTPLSLLNYYIIQKYFLRVSIS